MISENNSLKQSQAYPAPPDIGRLISKHLNKRRNKAAIHAITSQSYKVLSKVAVVFLVLSIAFAFSLQVSAVRSAIYKFIFTYEEEYTLVRLDKTTQLEFVDSEVFTWNPAYAPTMMPIGYHVDEIISMETQHIVSYKNQSDGYIEFWQSEFSSDGQWYTDTENADSVQKIFINDSEAMLINKQSVNSIIWRSGDVILNINTNEDTDTAIAIAKNIKLLR